MKPDELYAKLESYFTHTLDLMRHLHVNACWEYIITEKSTNDENVKLNYYLYKKSEDSLEMTTEDPDLKPDLILYFTEKAILSLIDGSPNADEYYSRYRKIMNSPAPDIELDNKVNKPRLKLWQIGYKNWQKDFNF